MSHTPGPWTITGRDAITLFGPDDKLIAALGFADRPIEESQANAALMIAAPDLLNACKSCLQAHLFENVFPEVHEIIVAAINKAEGI